MSVPETALLPIVRSLCSTPTPAAVYRTLTLRLVPGGDEQWQVQIPDFKLPGVANHRLHLEWPRSRVADEHEPVDKGADGSAPQLDGLAVNRQIGPLHHGHGSGHGFG